MRARSAFLLGSLALVWLALDARSARAEGISAGGGLAYGSEVEELGIQLNGYYDLAPHVENLRLGGAFTYYFADDPVTYWELDLNGQYVFVRPDQFLFYGFGGLNFSHVEVDLGFAQQSDTKVGLNLGIGGEFSVAEQVGLFVDLKYVVSDFDQAVIAFGARFAEA